MPMSRRCGHLGSAISGKRPESTKKATSPTGVVTNQNQAHRVARQG